AAGASTAFVCKQDKRVPIPGRVRAGPSSEGFEKCGLHSGGSAGTMHRERGDGQNHTDRGCVRRTSRGGRILFFSNFSKRRTRRAAKAPSEAPPFPPAERGRSCRSATTPTFRCGFPFGTLNCFA